MRTKTNAIRAKYNEQMKYFASEEGISLREFKNTKDGKRLEKNKYNALWRYRQKTQGFPSDVEKYDNVSNIAPNLPYYNALNYGYKDIDEVETKPKFDKRGKNIPPAMFQFKEEKEYAKKVKNKFVAVIRAKTFNRKTKVCRTFEEYQKEVREIYKLARKRQKKDGDSMGVLVDTIIGTYKGTNVLFVNVKNADELDSDELEEFEF